MMSYNFQSEVRFFMVYDILGDTVRSGPTLWKVDRKRLEDVKNHVLDLLLIAKILKSKLPDMLDYNKVEDYIFYHDLPEVITGDITKFEGVSEEEIKRVTQIAINSLAETFKDVLDLGSILNNYENRVDIESKVVHMLDKIQSSIPFMKYQSEQNIDMNHPDIIPELRNNPFVAAKIAEGYDLADIFFAFHVRSIKITDSECEKYRISKEQAQQIVTVIKAFADSLYQQKLDGTLCKVGEDFPKSAMVYKRTET